LQDGNSYTAEEVHKFCEECKYAFKRKRDQAADIGSAAHEVIEGRVNTAIAGGELRVDTSEIHGDSGLANEDLRLVENCVNAATEWLLSHNVVPIVAERRIYSRRWHFSGTADLIARVDDKLALVDWKSSKGLYPEYALQTAAYVKAYQEETGEKIQTRWLIRLGKEDGAFEAKQLTNLSGDWKAFKAALTLHNWQKYSK
jgi:ATP-dependent exoDNAse (exonuclease V) beta subunit